MRKQFVKLGIAVAAAALMAGMAGTAIADVVPPGQCSNGMTVGDWSAAWWQYILQIPASTNPAADTTGANCGVDQALGPIFFLAGNFTAISPLTRNCTVPAGKTLVIPIINTECSTLEPPPFYGANEKELRSCAAFFIDSIDPSQLTLTIDGVGVPNLGQFRAQSPVFGFHVPAKNILGLKIGAKVGQTGGSGFSVSDGYWAIVSPLSPTTPGNPHVIHFGGTIPGDPPFTVDVTYNLSVGSAVAAAAKVGSAVSAAAK